MSTTSKPHIAVIGAGVMGLSVGLCLIEKYGSQLDLTIIADKFSPDTTSDRAGAMILPGGNYIPGGDNQFEKDSEQWVTDTFHHINHVHQTYGEDLTGIHISPGYKFFRDKQPTPWFKDLLFDFKELSDVEAKALDLPYERFETIWSFRTFILKGNKYLPWVMGKIQENGGRIVQRKVESLTEPDLKDYDIIVNCSGLGARDLVADDLVFPISGQIVVVKAPWVKTIYYNREPDMSDVAYVIPHKDVVLLGGTAEMNSWSTTINEDTTEKIYQKCLKLAPELKGAEVIGGWVCLRPGRERVRLEIDTSLISIPVVHNYGHGGHGVMLSWGCAVQAVNLVQKCLEKRELVN